MSFIIEQVNSFNYLGNMIPYEKELDNFFLIVMLTFSLL